MVDDVDEAVVDEVDEDEVDNGDSEELAQDQTTLEPIEPAVKSTLPNTIPQYSNETQPAPQVEASEDTKTEKYQTALDQFGAEKVAKAALSLYDSLKKA